jgi:hypothetical protein
MTGPMPYFPPAEQALASTLEQRQQAEFNPYDLSALYQALNQTVGGMGKQMAGDAAGFIKSMVQGNPADPNHPMYGMVGPGSLGMVQAFHGSPHVFDQFSMGKVGSGEGAQSFGHGLYFAGKKEVADFYRQKLAKPSTPRNDVAKHWLDGAGGDPKVAVRNALAHAKETGLSPEEWADLEKSITEKPGATYKVDLDFDDVDLLDWDKPLKEQSDKVKALLDGVDPTVSGGDLYRRLSEELGGQEAASKKLREMGLRGLRYLDGSSRKKGQGSHNYVVFDDEAVKILERE